MFDRSKPMIGFHAILKNHEDVPAMLRVIEEGLAPRGFNTRILEARYQFTCFPEYSMGTVNYQDVRQISDACQRHGVRLVPLFPCLSHQSAEKRTSPYPLLRLHPEFMETPHMLDADLTWPDFCLHSWCASNDDIYQYVFPMIDEMAEACRADAVHIGHARIGRVASGDQFICNQAQKDKIIADTHALCTEMEGAAIAHAAYRNGIPFVILRAISDKADNSAEMDYPTFEEIAAHRCAEVTMNLAKALRESEEAE